MADSEEQSDAASYQPTMDLDRFRQLIREVEQENVVSRDTRRVKDVAKSSARNAKHNGVFMLRDSFLCLGVVRSCMQHTCILLVVWNVLGFVSVCLFSCMFIEP